MIVRQHSLLYLFTLFVLFGCQQGGEPVEIKWDRDSCENCRMLISHKNFATQIYNGSKTYLFDDIGCAAHWLKEHPEEKAVKIWVADYRSGKWLDAQSAHYVSGQTTPMDFGLGASSEPSQGSINFEAAKASLLEKRHEGH